MDFSFSEEQEMLREQARSLLSQRLPHERVVELSESDNGFDEGVWKEIAGLGWTGLSLPEGQGGAGMGFLDEAVLFEETGYGLFVGPFFATVGLALPALARHDELAAGTAAGDVRATLAWAETDRPYLDSSEWDTRAEGADGDWKLSGHKELVVDLGLVTHVVVVASTPQGAGLWAVATDGEGVTVEVQSTMDAGRRLGTLQLDRAPAALLAEPAVATELLADLRRRALAALALEGVGVAQRVLEMAIDYAKNRNQFDKPIGTYQAVSHQIADTYMETELARSLAYWAAWCVAED
ncbi:MAG: acyl-CoA/acyl-ACP dehydrogenase, partial [Actinomycetota bacterium]|nr:acyl-CoA/acyl-ACP dehydrogenase [Actinomycetota bacterium]